MNKVLTELEIQERVNFKMQQVLTGIKNTAMIKWHIAFENMDQKQSHYWEAFNQVKDMIHKEMRMGLPIDGNIVEEALRRKKDEAVEELSRLFDYRGREDYDRNIKRLVNIVEKAQI